MKPEDRQAFTRLMLEACGALVRVMPYVGPKTFIEYRGNGHSRSQPRRREIGWPDGLRCRILIATFTPMRCLIYLEGSAKQTDVAGQPWIRRVHSRGW